jgi:hypothetical protein
MRDADHEGAEPYILTSEEDWPWIPRTSGWLCQWQEMRGDSEQKIARPRPIYLGAGQRGYRGMGERDDAKVEIT